MLSSSLSRSSTTTDALSLSSADGGICDTIRAKIEFSGGPKRPSGSVSGSRIGGHGFFGAGVSATFDERDGDDVGDTGRLRGRPRGRPLRAGMGAPLLLERR